MAKDYIKKMSSLRYCRTMHEIVKYSPEYYNSSGVYLRDEWSSVYDIGKSFDGKVLSITDYLSVENAYLQAIKMIIIAAGCSYVTLRLFKRYRLTKDHPLFESNKRYMRDVSKYHSGSRIRIDNIDPIVILMLRGEIASIIVNDSRGLLISFGYDYYLGVHCKINNEDLHRIVNKCGLFLDPRG